MPRPDFVVAGHAVRDIVPGGSRLGGTVTFAAWQAHRLGLSVGVVTRAAPDLDVRSQLPFAQVAHLPSGKTTQFENVYDGGQRQQHLRGKAADLQASDVPEEWRASPVALIGPVFGEVPPDFARVFSDATLIGISAQGWLRTTDADERVLHSAWQGAPFWSEADVLFLSDEDLADGEGQLARWTAAVPIVAMTESWRGARVYAGGRWRRMDAFPEEEVDPTGAGDTFATAFLIRLHESGDVDEAARFGAAAASLSVGGAGAEAIPSRGEIEERMRSYPEVALR